MSVTGKQVILKARELMGVKWVHQGRHSIPSEGVDCLGLIIWTFESLDLGVIGEIANYRRMMNGQELKEGCDKWMDTVPGGVYNMRIGDVVVIAFRRYPIHIGFIADAGHPFSLIHALSTVGKVVEHTLDETWTSKIKRVYRFRGVE